MEPSGHGHRHNKARFASFRTVSYRRVPAGRPPDINASRRFACVVVGAAMSRVRPLVRRPVL
jgi:hypothetical protein